MSATNDALLTLPERCSVVQASHVASMRLGIHDLQVSLFSSVSLVDMEPFLAQ
jgi:hypothetical protein